MKQFYLLFCLSFVFTNAKAQTNYFKTFGGVNAEKAWGLCKNSDNGFAITGETNSFGTTGKDVYVIRLNAQGDTLWTKRYGGSNEETGESISQTYDGGFIITGETKSAGAGAKDIYLLKTDSNGFIEWSKTIGGTADEIAYSVIQTSDSGFAALGYTESAGMGGDIYLIKTNAYGTILWTKTFGGLQYEGGYSLIETLDSGFVFTGVTQSFGAGSYDVFLIKTDALGNMIWNKTYGGSNDDWGYCVSSTLDHGYIISGHTYSFGQGDYDILLLKTDSIGNLQWSKTYGNTGEDIGWFVVQNNDNTYTITGNTETPGIDHHGALLIKTDANGNQLWNKNFGKSNPSTTINSDVAVAIVKTTDGYAIAGNTTSFGAGSYDMLFIKTDTSGNGSCVDSSLLLNTGTPVLLTGTALYSLSSVGAVSTLNSSSATNTVVTDVCGLLGITSPYFDANNITLFPNPATSFLQVSVQLLNKNSSAIQICDVAGNVLLEIKNQNTIDVSALSKGFYVVKIKEGDNYFTRKFIKQ